MALTISGSYTFSGNLTVTGGQSAVVATPATDSYSMYNSLLLLGNGTNNSQNNTFLDSSTNNFSITRNGNTTQGTYSPYGSNWSYYNSSSGNTRLSIANNAALQFGTGDFTVEFWAYITGQHASDSYTGFLSFGGVYGTANTCLEFTMEPNGGFGVASITNTTTNFYISLIAGGSGLLFNTWHHFSVSRSGTTVRGFTDGVLKGTVTGNSTNLNGTGIGAIMFQRLDSTTTSTPGYISNVRALKGTALYTAAFTPPSSPLTSIANTSLLTGQSNRFVDNSVNAFTTTVSGTPSVQRFSPFGPGSTYSSSTIGGSAYFDGSGDSLQAPSGASISGTGDFTAECWIYPTTVPGTYNVIACSDTTGGLTMFGLNANGTIFMGRSLIDVQATTSNSLLYNTWNHIAVSRSSGTVRLFINGVQGYSGSITTNYNAGTVRFGTDGGGSALPYTGYISNFRIITNSAIYTSNFTPPTAPVTAISGTSLLLNHTNAGIIDSAMINNLETLGNAKISTTQSKFGGSSMYFDGTGDYLLGQTIQQTLTFGTGNFTVECWAYPVSYMSPVGGIVDSGSSVNGNRFSLVLYANGKIYVDNNTNLLISTTTISTGAWTHIAICRSNGTMTMYFNGTSVGSVASSTNFSETYNRIGSTVDGYSFNGYIDDLRVTKGYARYTANFTPPTAELPGQ